MNKLIKCKKCKIKKELSEFYKNNRKIINPRSNFFRLTSYTCKDCRCKQTNKNRKNNKERYQQYNKNWTLRNPEKRKTIRHKWQNSPKGYYAALKKRGMNNVKITQNEFIDWYNSQEKICFYCGLPEKLIEKFVGNKMSKSRRLSIDRVDPLGDYSINNIVLACGVCNLMKSNVLTKEEMLEVGKIIKIKWKKLYE